jgi:hypothetical protein
MFTFNNFAMMKKIFVLLLISYFIFLFFTACKKDFNVNAGWKDITVVYGILDQSDTIHYIRVNKAFLGIGNALIMAKNFDSINYPKGVLDVKLLEYTNNGLTLRNTYILAWDTVRKDLGVFYDPANPVQTVFTTNAKLNDNYTYKLEITNLKTGKVISGLTNLVSSFDIIQPSSIQKIYFIGKQEVSWYTANNGIAYQLIIRFHFDEINKSTNQQISKFIDWKFPIQTITDINSTQQLKYNFNADQFYFIVSSQVLVNPDVKRKPGKVDYIFLVADNDLNSYININQPSFSVVQQKPDFTNINNGIGIFASRYTNIRSLDLSERSIDSLKQGRYTKNLGFYDPNHP